MNLNNIAAMCTSVPLMLIMHKAQRLFHQSVMSVTPSPLIKIEYLMIKTITYLGSYHSKRKLKFAFQIFQLPAREWYCKACSYYNTLSLYISCHCLIHSQRNLLGLKYFRCWKIRVVSQGCNNEKNVTKCSFKNSGHTSDISVLIKWFLSFMALLLFPWTRS